ncbi:MAG TPA: HYR domain-containing protein [Gaiellaceae bacterium]|nr:HYR domain-containing protein [Gaiellaceae bacterium]
MHEHTTERPRGRSLAAPLLVLALAALALAGMAVPSPLTDPACGEYGGPADGEYSDPAAGEYSDPASGEYCEPGNGEIQLVVPGNLTITAPPGATSVGLPIGVHAFAADGSPLTPVCSPPADSLFPIGQTLVECTAEDAQGNSASASFTVTVVAANPCLLPATPNAGLTNIGFETGDLSGWRTGIVAQGVAVTGADAFTSPYEGSSMARLGHAAGSASVNQPAGMNQLCQDFVVTNAVERFVYNVFTYDYTGFDNFEFELRVVDPSTGAIIAAHDQGAWGSGTALKTSGWKGVELDLAAHVGQTVRLVLSAGGTQDDLYSFWAYVDAVGSAGMPVEVAAVAGVASATGSVMTDPQTGQITVGMPSGSKSDVTLSSNAICPDGSTPTNVTLMLNGTGFAMSESSSSPGTWSVTIPAESVQSGVLTIVVACPGASLTNTIGAIQLYDPSGFVTDAVTGEPIPGASVTLHKVPGWSAKTSPDDDAPNTCQSHQSKAEGAPWNQPAPVDLGVPVIPYGNPEISPKINPFITNAQGRYGWDVAAGCWYVVVSKDGYHTLTSPVVGVPPEVTDLDLALTPIAAPPSDGQQQEQQPQPSQAAAAAPAAPVAAEAPRAPVQVRAAADGPLRASRGAVVLVATRVAVDAPARLVVTAYDVRTQKSLLLRRGSRVASSVSGKPRRTIVGDVGAAGTAPLVLRVAPGQLQRGRAYRIAVIAIDANGARSRIDLPFRR